MNESYIKLGYIADRTDMPVSQIKEVLIALVEYERRAERLKQLEEENNTVVIESLVRHLGQSIQSKLATIINKV